MRAQLTLNALTSHSARVSSLAQPLPRRTVQRVSQRKDSPKSESEGSMESQSKQTAKRVRPLRPN